MVLVDCADRSLVPHGRQDHLVRGVDRFFHEDGTTSESTTGGFEPRPRVETPLHREDGPAVQMGNPHFAPGGERWYRHGRLHRENGPAVIVPCFGYPANEPRRVVAAYYVDGELHREDGPAVRSTNGDEERWVRGERTDAPKLRRPSMSERDAARWDALRETARPWSRDTRFAEGDAISHVKLGLGVVHGLAGPDRIVVRFEDGSERVLLHLRG